MPTTHAEMDVLNKIRTKRELPAIVDIFVIRLTKTGLLGESRPCYHCLDALGRSRLHVRDVYYSISAGTIFCERFSHMKESDLTYVSMGMRISLYKKEKKILLSLIRKQNQSAKDKN